LALCIAGILSACADKAEIRDRELERYKTLESELIDAQQAEVQRRRTQLRVAQQLRQMDAERAEAARKRLQDQDALQSLPQVPLVTQITVGQPDSGIDSEVWKFQDYPSPIDGSTLCAVVSIPIDVQNGPLETKASVIIGKDSIFLRTDATFDDTALETGYRVDAGFPIAFDQFINEVTAVVDENYARLLELLKDGSTLAVSFALSPQLSTAETHIVELSLDAIDKPLSELAECDDQKPADS
jgi:hypothetical protein